VDDEAIIGSLEVFGMEDGGWYWIKGDSDVAVASLMPKSAVSENPKPFNPGGIDVKRGRYGSYFIHKTSRLSGIVPHRAFYYLLK